MTKDEALRLALDALSPDPYRSEWAVEEDKCKAIIAIKAALEAKDEPVKLRRGDILRCNESDELCTVWATSTSGKTLVKWKDNDFGNYTAEQIGELFWIEPKEEDEPDYKALWQQMCERCDELDKKLAQQEHEPVVFNTLASLKHKKTVGPIESAMSNTTPPQRTWVGLSNEDKKSFWTADQMTQEEWDELFSAIEAKLKQKNFKE